jgi:CPA2 family monovalent cation:H+ antiporter-2
VSSLSDFFLALFFVALGSFLLLPSPRDALYALVIAAFVLFVTPPLVTAVAERQGMTARASIESGLLLAQMSEFSLVAVIVGTQIGHVAPDVFPVLALATVITMTVTPFVATDGVTARLLRLHPFRATQAAPSGLKGHVLILGFGTGGMWVVRPLAARGHQILVVDDDPAVIEQLRRQKIACIRGDGSDEVTLQRAGARDAALIIASMRRVTDSIKVLRHAHSGPVIIRVFERSDAERVQHAGGIPVLNSVAAAETFMEWYAQRP